MKKIFIFAAAALVLTACAQKRFDSVESTPVSRYDIVYDGGRCGVFDNEADSLVTPIEYDSEKSGGRLHCSCAVQLQ